MAGEYEEGKNLLEKNVEGQFKTSDAYLFQMSTYYIGRALEGMGLEREAVDHYSDFLKYWSGADIQIEAIRDARERLSTLTS